MTGNGMDLPQMLTVLGALFLAGLAADRIGASTRLPRVTLLLACGIAAGGAGFDLLPETARSWYEFLSVTALTMVAFLLGGALTRDNLATHGRAILSLSLSIVLVTVLLVAGGLAVSPRLNGRFSAWRCCRRRAWRWAWRWSPRRNSPQWRACS